ncbi:hypothetical protein N9W78_00495 [bacterium]|nr:hypothetical protein [bacterium]
MKKAGLDARFFSPARFELVKKQPEKVLLSKALEGKKIANLSGCNHFQAGSQRSLCFRTLLGRKGLGVNRNNTEKSLEISIKQDF